MQTEKDVEDGKEKTILDKFRLKNEDIYTLEKMTSSVSDNLKASVMGLNKLKTLKLETE